jgi:hypothetical protein
LSTYLSTEGTPPGTGIRSQQWMKDGKNTRNDPLGQSSGACGYKPSYNFKEYINTL